MKTIGSIIAAIIAIATGVVAASPTTSPSIKVIRDPLAAQLGKPVTLIGEAEVQKEGACLRGMDFHIYVDALQDWPKELVGKKVSVSGIVIERYDLPVYVSRPGGPVRDARPVPAGTDVHKAAHRYLLKDAKWRPL